MGGTETVFQGDQTMSRNTLSVTGTGDSLFLARFPEEYTQGWLRGIAACIQGFDCRRTNRESDGPGC
jgi:hypothetical protein